ncbi:cation:proton antiporter [Candidatus Saccharibacteria bacterium]|nr:cation:proton antiporter [Candidatus Saccharibacteria bacterium]
MHQSIVFNEIGMVIALGASISLVMRIFKQPLIIGHILTGILAGPFFLKIIHADASFNGLAEIGVALLLFIIGLDLSLKTFSRVSKTVLTTTALQIGLITSIGYASSRLLDFSKTESFILGLGLAMSSTIIIVKLLNDKKELTRLYAQIAIGVLLLQDVIATIAKIALATKTHEGSVLETIIILGIRGLILVFGLYLLVRYLIPMFTKTIEQSKELLVIFALGWGLGFALLFARVGFSIEIGALFAGISLAGLPYSNEMASRLKPLRDFFLIIFFITLGQTMAPGTLGNIIAPAIILSLIVLILKPLVVMIGMGALGYTKRASFKTAIAMSQVSEFSLVFLTAGVASGFVTERASTTLTLTALITFAISAYLINYDNALYSKLEQHLRLFERKMTKVEQRSGTGNHPIVLFGYRKGGHEFLKTFKRMQKKYIVVDYDPENIETFEHQHIPYLYGDATDPELLDELNLSKARLIISTIADPETNHFLAKWLAIHNPNAVFVCSAERAQQATELYELGASYVMMPHYIGSEKISSFIRRNGFNKSEFKNYRQKHLIFLQTHIQSASPSTES